LKPVLLESSPKSLFEFACDRFSNGTRLPRSLPPHRILSLWLSELDHDVADVFH